MHLRADAHEKAAALWMQRAGLKVPLPDEIEAFARGDSREEPTLVRLLETRQLEAPLWGRFPPSVHQGKIPFREEWKVCFH